MADAIRIQTGQAQLDPPKIAEIVDLNLNIAISTTIPQGGSFEYLFPDSITQLPYETAEGCFLVSKLLLLLCLNSN